MIKLNEYINENILVNECLKTINESNDHIELPYTFDIYNEGPKNKDYKITKANIYKIFFSIGKKKEFDEKDGKEVIKFIEHYNQMICLPLPADKITYRQLPNKENTKNWTKIPEIIEYTYAGGWYSDKFVEYNYQQYNKDWNKWFSMIKPYMKGKISITITKETIGKENYLVFNLNDNKFNEERENKLKELKNPDNLRKWADEADVKEKAKIEQIKKDEEAKKKAAEDWDKWWNSLSDYEQLRWSMGYGRKSGNYTGD